LHATRGGRVPSPGAEECVSRVGRRTRFSSTCGAVAFNGAAQLPARSLGRRRAARVRAKRGWRFPFVDFNGMTWRGGGLAPGVRSPRKSRCNGLGPRCKAASGWTGEFCDFSPASAWGRRRRCPVPGRADALCAAARGRQGSPLGGAPQGLTPVPWARGVPRFLQSRLRAARAVCLQCSGPVGIPRKPEAKGPGPR
jgi:hypothetical protein